MTVALSIEDDKLWISGTKADLQSMGDFLKHGVAAKLGIYLAQMAAHVKTDEHISFMAHNISTPAYAS